MIDRHEHVCHRMQAAQATGDRHAAQRGYVFDQIVDESPIWIRALAETFRPRSLFLLAVIAGVAALWWL